MATPRTLRRAVSDEDKEQRRQDILAAALEVFAAKGYHETTMADIARGTGLSYGVVYWYFESKDDLFQALMSLEEQTLRDRISVAVVEAGQGDIGALLRTVVRTIFEHFDEHPASTRLLFRDTQAFGERFERHLSDIFSRFIADLEALVVDAQRRGYLRDAPPRMVAYSCAALTSQIALRRQRSDEGLSAADAADFTVGLLIDGLRPRTDGAGAEGASPKTRRRSTAGARTSRA
jgi:AcrR family transcriptional regulator